MTADRFPQQNNLVRTNFTNYRRIAWSVLEYITDKTISARTKAIDLIGFSHYNLVIFCKLQKQGSHFSQL